VREISNDSFIAVLCFSTTLAVVGHIAVVKRTGDHGLQGQRPAVGRFRDKHIARNGRPSSVGAHIMRREFCHVAARQRRGETEGGSTMPPSSRLRAGGERGIMTRSACRNKVMMIILPAAAAARGAVPPRVVSAADDGGGGGTRARHASSNTDVIPRTSCPPVIAIAASLIQSVGCSLRYSHSSPQIPSLAEIWRAGARYRQLAVRLRLILYAPPHAARSVRGGPSRRRPWSQFTPPDTQHTRAQHSTEQF